ncbi:MAG: chromate transporter [Oscillospiraceae bacterium]|nr:chromate transporter [Oscillospiraceae bacterium]
MLYLTLFLIFARIGLFTVGGGAAMLPLVCQALMERGWMTLHETIDMAAISQMTPGPFAVNAATFTGMRLSGVWGAAAATLGVMAPSLVIVTLTARWFFKFKDARAVQAVLKGVRPVIPALIAASVWMMAGPSLTASDGTPALPLMVTALAAAGLARKLNPAWVILAGGVAGALFFRPLP